ncbi:hypothetical protein ACFY7H_30425 [Streptomyces sp. NPDC012794]|uniref:hypothetical protein n=1 Tax=Streptomyces sp. NPDC012794 TaxID=3364850 RepID=UPI0036ADC212
MALIPPVNGTAGASGRFNTHCYFKNFFLELMAQSGTSALGSRVMNPSRATARGRLFDG